MKFKTNFTDRIYNLNPSICFYDKDNVLVDSSHRARLDEHGNFDLDYWRENKTKDKIFSDILLIPHVLGLTVNFLNRQGPSLKAFDMYIFKSNNFEIVEKKLSPVYELIKLVSSSQFTNNKTTIGFVGAPWTLLVYMINKKSPKLDLNENFFGDPTVRIILLSFSSTPTGVVF